MHKILVIGQIPPPHHGQAMMIKHFIEGKYSEFDIVHLRMEYEENPSHYEKFKVKKIFHFFFLLFKSLKLRYENNISTLMYCPCGSRKIAMLRDLFFLLWLRPFFLKTIFYMQSAGMSNNYPKLNFVLKFLFRKAFFNPDLVIRLSEHTSPDDIFLRSKKSSVVYNGIPDFNFNNNYKIKKSRSNIRLLFVGLICEEKGVLELIDAFIALYSINSSLRLTFIGEFESHEIQNKIFVKCNALIEHEVIQFKGLLVGDEKIKYYHKSDIFCFPSYYRSESFPLVLIEACCSGLPIVSTYWRGIPSIVEDGVNGFLIKPMDISLLIEKLKILILKPNLRKEMGDQSRIIFMKKFNLHIYQNNMEKEIFKKLILNE